MDRFAHVETLSDFWALVIDVWQHGFMGIAIGQIVLALIVLAVAALMRRLFGSFVVHRLRARLGASRLDEAFVDAVGPPIRFIPFVLAVFVISRFATVNPDMATVFAEINRSLIAFTIFWLMFKLVAPLCALLDGRAALFSPVMVGWATRMGRIFVAAIGGATILDIWGIKVGPILAGLGLFGAAVALGAQDVFKNLIAGIFIIAERRFQTGDWILAENVVEGTVETIGLRTTKVRRFDKAPVYVPNAKLADNAVTNYTQMTYRRISWIVGLEYGTNIDQLRRIRDEIEAYLLGNDDFAHPPAVPTFVRVDKFNDSSIDLMIYCFTRTTVWGEWLEIKESLTYAIKRIVEDAGSGFAFPSRSLYVETLPNGADLLASLPDADAAPSATRDVEAPRRGSEQAAASRGAASSATATAPPERNG